MWYWEKISITCIRQFKANIEAKRNFATHYDSAVEITDPKRQLKAWSEMRLIILQTLHRLSIKSLIEKFKLTQVPITGSHTQELDMSIMSFHVTPFCRPMFKRFAQ